MTTQRFQLGLLLTISSYFLIGCGDVKYIEKSADGTQGGLNTTLVDTPDGTGGPDDGGPDDEVCTTSDKIFVQKNDGAEQELKSFEGDLSVSDFYNYYSWSVHPDFGPDPANDTLNIYLYKNGNGTSLFYFAGKDNNRADADWEDVDMDFSVISDGLSTELLVEDDAGESVKVGEGQFEARMSYIRNSDGGVIGHFDETEFSIEIDILRTTNISRILVSGDDPDQSYNLSESDNETMTIKIASKKVETCVPKVD